MKLLRGGKIEMPTMQLPATGSARRPRASCRNPYARRFGRTEPTGDCLQTIRGPDRRRNPPEAREAEGPERLRKVDIRFDLRAVARDFGAAK